jgi:alkylation response protein AidB-like acyl-CoA dehydrogenase
MHSTLPPEIEAFRMTVRRMAEANFRDLAVKVDKGELIPATVRPLLAEIDAFGLPFPSAVGGGDGSFLAWAVLQEEIGRVMPVLGIYLQVNLLVAGILLESATDEQISEWVPALLDGSKTGFMAFTEPQTGSDIAMMTTRARKVDGGWSISGRKMWISNAATASLGVVYARDPDDGLSMFLVPADAPGFRVGPSIEIMGLRGTELNELEFDEVFVPEENLLGGKTGIKTTVLRKVMPIGKIGICAVCVGLMQSCLEEATRYAKQRVQQGHPIIDFQAIHYLIAEMVAALEASRQMVYWAATCKDQGADAITELATTKLFVTNAAIRVARMAVSVHGVYGIAKGAVVERLLRDVQVFELFEGPSEIQREMVMRAVRDIE